MVNIIFTKLRTPMMMVPVFSEHPQQHCLNITTILNPEKKDFFTMNVKLEFIYNTNTNLKICFCYFTTVPFIDMKYKSYSL